jgi:DNA-binding LacI/PurR family transcriptional regulator
VSEAATTLGYVPNSAARALVRRRSGLIGVVTGDFDEPGLAPALAGLGARLTDAGWALLWGACRKDRTPLDQAQALVGHGVEALAVVGVGVPPDLGEVRGIQRLPCVSVDRTDAAGFTVNAGLDLARAGKLIADYLGQLGHRRSAVIAESRSVVGALLVDGLRLDKVPACFSLELLTMDDEPLAKGLSKWFVMPNPPTAAICGSDAIALAVMHACARHGIDVPGRMSIMGFGDTPLARGVSPMLTSVRIPARGAGVAAAEYLLARLAGRVSDITELPIKLVVRASTGPPMLS